MEEFNIELPINSLSFGQVSVGLLVEMYRRDLRPNIFPIGNTPDLSAYDLPDGFQEWLQNSISGAIKHLHKKLPTLRFWHLNGSHSLIPSSRNVLFTFHETSELTSVEINICDLYDKVLVASEYSVDVFTKSGVSRVEWCPAYFDANHFKKIDTRKQEGVINFSLIGKMEKRKLTHEIVATWASLFAGNPKYRLNTLLFNPFLPPEIQQRSLDSIFRGQVPFNINQLGFQPKNSAVNELLNFIDIDLSLLSGAEGFGLPGFNALCLGKQCVALNAHAHKSFVNAQNSILVEPSGTRELWDGVFFIKGADFNQGSQFTFDAQEASKAIQKAVELAGTVNTEGEKLKEIFTVQRTLDIILKNLV